ncbi:MAG TPA: hypothetical protein VIL69_14445 [Roseomonas sp.]
MQRHPTYGDPFRKRASRPRREAAVGRFAGIEAQPWDPVRPKEEWTEEERRGAAGLRAVRAVLWLTVTGAIAALAVGLWRVFLAG